MIVNLRSASKRVNSTGIPSAGTDYTGRVVEPCSILSPTIKFAERHNNNYAYIPEFNRYYWVGDWTFQDGFWHAPMAVDVLATYKGAIGSASRYVLRAAADHDPLVLDTFYPAKGETTTQLQAVNGPSWADTLTGGYYIVGVVGLSNTFAAGGVGYMVLSPSNYQALIDDVFTQQKNVYAINQPSQDFGEALTDFGRSLIRSIVNPAQYITSVMWVPFAPPTTGATGAITCGTFTTNVSGSAMGNPVQVSTWTFALTSPSGDLWKNYPPFARYRLVFPPFGDFELDGALLAQCTGLTVTVRTDCITGAAVLQAVGTGSPLGVDKRVLMASGMVGVPMPLAGSNVNTATQLIGTVGAVAAIGAAVAAPGLGTIAGALSSIGNAAANAAPVGQMCGSVGGIGAVSAPKSLVKTYFTPVDQDNTEHGRPLCAIRQLSTLPGYQLVRDGDIPITGTAAEQEQVRQFLESGYFYE